MTEYGSLLILIIVSVIIGLIIEGGSYLLGRAEQSGEKMSAFECGFDAFESSRDKFDVSFYLVGMLFLIFDLEASYLYPFAVVEDLIGMSGLFGMLDFIVELVIGLIYIYSVNGLSLKYND